MTPTPDNDNGNGINKIVVMDGRSPRRKNREIVTISIARVELVRNGSGPTDKEDDDRRNPPQKSPERGFLQGMIIIMIMIMSIGFSKEFTISYD